MGCLQDEVVSVLLIHLSGSELGFLIWFLAHDLRGSFCNLLPAPQICKSSSQSNHDFPSQDQSVSRNIVAVRSVDFWCFGEALVKEHPRSGL
jgi:hypothetical protein